MADNGIEKKVVDLPIDDILPNRYQPRIKFDDDSIFELSESIKTHGVFQPILVRPIGDKYEIIAGERRYKASVLASRKTIPAIIMSLNDKDTVEIALIENVQRSNLTPIEEAISYKKILDMGYIRQEDLAHKLGKTQSTIANKLRLLNLEEDVQEALLEGSISERHARSLLRLKNPDDQRIMLKRVINERLTVRKTDEEIVKMLENNDMNNNNLAGTAPVVETPVNVENTQSTVTSGVEEVNDFFMPSNDTSSSIFGFSNGAAPAQTTVNNSTVISSEQAPVVESINVEQTDINQIQNNAAPVFEEKPLANMEDLMRSDTNAMPATEEVKDENYVTNGENNNFTVTGKFFNFNAPEESKNEVTRPNNDAAFNFNNFVKAPEKETVEEPVPSFDSLFGNKMVVNNEEAQDAAPTQNISQPAPTFENISQPVTPAMPEAAPAAPVEPATNSSFGFFNQPVEAAPVAPVEPTQAQAPMFGTPGPVPAPTAEPIQPENEEPAKPTVSVGDIPILSQAAPIMPAAQEEDEIVIPANPAGNTAPAQMSNPTLTVQADSFFGGPAAMPAAPQPKNVMGAVNVIREAVAKLEAMGFAVDVDEIDLESIYQLIIKIDK